MSYDVYEPGAERATVTDEELGGAGPWRVALEYSNRGDAKPPTLVQIGRTQHADRAVALQAAHRAAVEFNPPDPWAPQKREIFRDGPDGFLVLIHGSMSTFHMSVRIVAPLPDPPAQP